MRSAKHFVSQVIVLGVVVCLAGVGARAQEASGNTNMQTVRATVGESGGAAPANPLPAARPQSSPDDMTSKLDIFVGYSFLDNGYPLSNNCFGGICEGRWPAHGWNLDGTWNLNKYVGLTADFSGHNGSPTRTTTVGSNTRSIKMDQDFYSFLFGPTVSHSAGSKVRVYAHGLVGLARADLTETSRLNTNPPSVSIVRPNTGFSVGIGGGADYQFRKHWGWRIAQLDYIFSDLQQCQSTDTSQPGCSGTNNNIRVSTGITWSFGEMK